MTVLRSFIRNAGTKDPVKVWAVILNDQLWRQGGVTSGECLDRFVCFVRGSQRKALSLRDPEPKYDRGLYQRSRPGHGMLDR